MLSQPSVPARCPPTSADYDRGFELVTEATSIQQEDTLVAYDGFGRLTSLTRPDPAGGTPQNPSVTIEYFLPPDLGGTAHSIVHTSTQDGATVTDGSNYLESFTYIDGFGRTILTLNEADPTQDGRDDGQWIVAGMVDYDDKAALRRKYLEFFWDGNPLDFQFETPPPSPYGRQRYDAFGRQIRTYDLDGTITLASVYHALSTDLYDAADLEPGRHQGTHATERRDGHGRTVEVIERWKDGGGTPIERSTQTQYLQTNEPEIITRTDGTDSVVRWLRYDSLGRMVLNVEPNTTPDFTTDHTVAESSVTGWRYVYDDFGDLVGTSDARGCGVNYHYDGAGRLAAEDYSPCLGTHAAYSAPDFTDGYVGFEVKYGYDALTSVPTELDPPTEMDLDTDFQLGRLTATWSRGNMVYLQYDARGRVVRDQMRLKVPTEPGATVDDLRDRYSQNLGLHRFLDYDALDREILRTSPIDPDQGGVSVSGVPIDRNDQSAVTTTYSRYALSSCPQALSARWHPEPAAPTSTKSGKGAKGGRTQATPAKTYQTYTKPNPKTGEVYSGKTSGTGTPAQSVASRDRSHHMNEQGFGPAKLDKSSSNADAIRGREQNLIDTHGGAKSKGGTSGNRIQGISDRNKNRQRYLDAAKKEFGK